MGKKAKQDKARKEALRKKRAQELAEQQRVEAGKAPRTAEEIAADEAAKAAANETPAASTVEELVEERLKDAGVVEEDAPTLSEGMRAATGILVSHPLSRDIQIDQFSLSFHGTLLIEDTELRLNYGRRYGLIGLNGSGKTTLLRTIGHREVPIPSHVDLHLLEREVEGSEQSALDCVLSVRDTQVKRLEAEADVILTMEGGAESERLQQIYETLYEDLDMDKALPRAAEILHGLGFTPEMQQKKTKDFSGGWRMRIALAQALLLSPSLLLLDEPTNHLDLEACVWLEEYLRNYKKCLLFVSHSQDFMNGVCTNIVLLRQKKLSVYSGNYDTYVSTRLEQEEHQMKQYKWEQDQIKNMKEYIARFGHGSAKLARQAQSKEKALEKMSRNLTEKVVTDRVVSFHFPDCGNLAPPVLQFTEVSFGYPTQDGSAVRLLYKNVDLAIDLDSRIALVGPNGAGKSTLLKLMVGELLPVDGDVSRHHHLRIARYHQHLADTLDFDLAPLEFMLKEFPDTIGEKAMRSQLGRFGVTGKVQVTPMGNLSDGEISRVVFSWLAFTNPHLLLLDEPTNHLDIESIDCLADAINGFEGGVVLVSHDFRLIDQVAKEIWLCEKGGVTKFQDDIHAYKNHLRQQHGLDALD
eukprot:TRINITY_DN2095_c0_g2_i1.p1 TRINITY_DN2095_c0_g2~~TRINITY_DN2095_c0_g2_i1.p1  ORF type:complete len:659 (+),score=279.72 TRINITY_DN2095_c0_g2_i1:64-1977(+)